MAEYHSQLTMLEGMVATRIRLIGRGSSHDGIDRKINAELSKLLREASIPTCAEEYCCGLKIVRQ